MWNGRCVACGSSLARKDWPTIDVGSSPVVLAICEQCGTETWASLTPQAGAEDVSIYWEVYKAAVDLSDDVREAFGKRYRRAFELAATVVDKPSRCLDIGGGSGNFALWAEQELSLWTLTCDVDMSAIEMATSRGVRATSSANVAAALAGEPVDVVTLWDVIEHVSDPTDLMEQARSSLRPGGALILETPDASFIGRKIARWLNRLTRSRIDITSPLYYWEHKIYYTEEGLRQLCARFGLRVTVCERWTSPRTKMVKLFEDGAELQSTAANRRFYSAIAVVYPLAERVLRFLGIGNKLVIVATREDS